MKAKLHVHKTKFHVDKIHRCGVTGQGYGMPCPCNNVVAQHIDIEPRNYIFTQIIRFGNNGRGEDIIAKCRSGNDVRRKALEPLSGNSL